MVAYKEFTAWIEIEGQRAAEYGIETKRDEDGVKVVSCWIPSEAGKVRSHYRCSSFLQVHVG